MPSTWDRFKAVIWDRGHNLGAFTRPHAALKGFPTDGFLDFQFGGDYLMTARSSAWMDFLSPCHPLSRAWIKPCGIGTTYSRLS